MTEPFTWKNCMADVHTYRHGRMARAYFDDVVAPSLDALNAQIDEWSRSDSGAAAFAKDDVEELRRVTMLAFCLSIQSMWERQIRTYLRGCADELKPDSGLASKAMTVSWGKMDKLFHDLRGISLREFDEYADLDLLHLLGNACRHGDGKSARQLWEKYPGLWPTRRRPRARIKTPVSQTEKIPSIDSIVISRDLVGRFVDAIASFWDETEYIYLESIERKHESVEAKLVTMRRERAARRKTRGSG